MAASVNPGGGPVGFVYDQNVKFRCFGKDIDSNFLRFFIMPKFTEISSDVLYAHKCCAIKNSCVYLQKMDESESADVRVEHEKIRVVWAKHESKIGAGIGAVLGVIAIAMSPVALLLTIPIGAAIIAAFPFLYATIPVKTEIDRDRLSRLDSKVHSIAQRLLRLESDEQNDEERLQLNVAKDYFTRALLEHDRPNTERLRDERVAQQKPGEGLQNSAKENR
ncbi:MAG: hypothetical protein HW387_1320 [Parachlamydiales bacterium]|nr:hypothetical protein [Parachlamydiales bacterium]